ncbi:MULTISPECIES: bifunctional diguanylate cyclase/phosphodiesterase [unclassified Acidiphilium]|uniref:putative bifunctional diguanylate cyclase/phosphodiesterase n=1 Tax=unclassified Acidiphilium TaxID=2617493 RepID=UPI000BC61364|nr:MULTISPECIES: EAL domain-containing protein [unclassified Acidiphilium]OYV57476.1 MAG: hypothetical protein B7Z76_01505 [Acidiphilium sp. 20-67-58]HQT59652.1 EAL domain-containing protein [Acidiphilium sp.]
MRRWRRLFVHLFIFFNFIESLFSARLLTRIVPESFRTTVQISQIDTRARLSMKMAVMGEIALIAFTSGFIGSPANEPILALVIALSIFYTTLVFLGQFWIRSRRKIELLKFFFRIYGFLQFSIGAGWGGIIISTLPHSNAVQMAQIYAILIGLISTAVFAGPITFSLLFWTPLVTGSMIALLLPASHTQIATLVGMVAYDVVSFILIIELSRKLVEREVGAIRIARLKEETEILLRDFQQGASDWLFELDDSLTIVNPSERFCEVARRRSSAMQVNLRNLLLDGDGSIFRHRDEAIDKLMAQLESHLPFRDMIVSIPFDGELRWWDLSAKPIFKESGELGCYRGVGRDITDLHRSRERVTYLARHDPLTTLFNRDMFAVALAQAIDEAEQMPAALLCVDLDYFKTVNDSFGHAVGDNLLRAAAERLCGCVRGRDMVFRLGGDEFAIIVPGVQRPEVASIAARIVEHLGQPFRIRSLTMTVGVSVGIAMLPNDARTPEGIHHCADLALYQAKVEGRGRFNFFNSDTQDAITRRIAIHADLKNTAIRNQLFLEYQPIVDLRTGAPVAMEALVRWRHPARGIISPGEFISIAEDSGLIGMIGKYVIDMACQAAAQLTQDLQVTINLSPRQLRDETLPDKIAEVMEQNGLGPGRIAFEITETCLLDVSGHSLDLLDRIRALGCEIILDDFGTGYSSFRPIHEYKFDRIKIAQALLEDVFLHTNGRVILETVINMGQRIGIDMIAEGIETESQAGLLRDLGCPYGQGYWFSRPISEVYLLENYGVSPTAVG